MRREDRAVYDADAIEAIIGQCGVCHLALSGGATPYVIPMNFGYAREGDAFTLYFHCAREGVKLDRIRACPRAAFSMVAEARVVADATASHYTTHYKSVAGTGVLAFARNDAGKRRGLEALMRGVAPGKTFDFPASVLAALEVLQLTVEEITGKQNPKKG